ncbi:MAG: hypothetical protein IIY58_03375 [Aeriscardovia sp.]|nr:hypothetical protein [Aeriscardovia sp.]
MFNEKELNAQKADLIDKVCSMTPEQYELLLYLLERHEVIDALDEPARTAKMQELKDEFMRNRQAGNTIEKDKNSVPGLS